MNAHGNAIKEKGFTLLEVLVAISILSIGLLAVASMQTGSVTGNATAYRQTESLSIAQDRIERLLALPFDDGNLNDGINQADPFGPAPGIYTVTYDVDDGDAAGGWSNWDVANSKLIRVRVVRTEKGHAYRPVLLRALKLLIS
jgi:type IV pilus assembly protein PilV